MSDQPANPNDIVIYHVKRLAGTTLQQTIFTQAQGKPKEVDMRQVFGHNSSDPAKTSIIITQFTTICLCQPLQTVQSRFFMHDLIKITSRKSSAKIITFYFRIPQFGEYNSQYYEQLEVEPDEADQKVNVILNAYN